MSNYYSNEFPPHLNKIAYLTAGILLTAISLLFMQFDVPIGIILHIIPAIQSKVKIPDNNPTNSKLRKDQSISPKNPFGTKQVVFQPLLSIPTIKQNIINGDQNNTVHIKKTSSSSPEVSIPIKRHTITTKSTSTIDEKAPSVDGPSQNVGGLNGGGENVVIGPHRKGSPTGNGGGNTIIGKPVINGRPKLKGDELAAWMKKHPYPFNGPVKDEMEWRPGDLTSRVPYRYKGQDYTIYILCRENTSVLTIGFARVDSSKFTIVSDEKMDGKAEKFKDGNATFDERGEVISLDTKDSNDFLKKGGPYLNIFMDWWRGVKGGRRQEEVGTGNAIG